MKRINLNHQKKVEKIKIRKWGKSIATFLKFQAVNAIINKKEESPIYS